VAVAELLTALSFAASLEVNLVFDKVVKSRLESGRVAPRAREATIGELFKTAGCPIEEQRIDKHAGNVICTLPGQTGSTVVIGGHYDFAEYGEGIVDDWSGVSLLPSLYQSLLNLPRRHTYVFVAFGGEEKGLAGSSQYVKNLTPEQKTSLRAFVNIECLGLTPVKVWTHRSTPALVLRLSEVAHAIGITLQGVNVDRVGDDDTHPFFNAHVPVISIHSVTQETLPILHSKKDRLDAIHFDDYYNAYKLLAHYLAYLDEQME